MTDNEPSFTSAPFKSFVQRCGLTLHYADPRHSNSNWQVERAHSILTELARCIEEEFNLTDFSKIVIKAAQVYYQSIQSTTNQKPFDVLYYKIKHDNIPQILKNTQEKMLETQWKQKRKSKSCRTGSLRKETRGKK